VARALLTGITGFIGSHLARHLVAAGDEVHAVVRPSSRLDRIPDVVGDVRLHVDDGSTAALHQVVAAAAPDVTFHLATHFIVAHAPGDAERLVADNVGFPTRLAEALAAAGSRRFVNAGTSWQHVGGAPYRPKNLYAATKQAFEDVLGFYAVADLLDAVTVNLYDTYGPLDHRGKLVSALVAAAVAGGSMDMSSGEQLVDLLHVDDVVRALVAAAGTTGVHAVSSGAPRTIRQVVELLGDLSGQPLDVRWGVRPDRPDEMLSHWDAGPPLPGWQPEVVLSDGLAALLREARSAGS
jgi:nucleoside-diphosphate-sugar epimerase